MPKCPRRSCNNEAIISTSYGILPCEACQKKDSRISRIRRSPEFYSIHKLHRVQKQRDGHGKDLLQPYIGDKVNEDYFKAYPDQVDSYKVKKELEKL